MIQRLTADDLDELCRLEQAAAAQPWSKASLQEALNSTYGSGWILREPSPMAYLFGHQLLDEAEIYSIGVAPHARRRGHGRTLLTHGLMAWKLHGVGRVHLEVRDDNLPALALYHQEGFKTVGRRKNYYGDTDALLLQVIL